MARGLSQGFKRNGSRRGGGGGGGKGLGMPVVLGGLGVLVVVIIGGLFFLVHKAESNPPPKAQITHEAKNVGGG